MYSIKNKNIKKHNIIRQFLKLERLGVIVAPLLIACQSTNYNTFNQGLNFDLFNKRFGGYYAISNYDGLQRQSTSIADSQSYLFQRGYFNFGKIGLSTDENNNRGGEKKMTEMNDILSNLSSFIICGYTLIKSIIAIVKKIKKTN